MEALESVAEDFGLPTFNLADEGDEGTVDGPEVDVDQIFGGQQQTQSNEEEAGSAEKTTQETQSKDTEAQGEENAEGGTQAPTDFSVASDQAFFADGGDLDTAKVEEYITSGNKSFLQFESNPDPIKKEEPVEREDPEKKYTEDVLTVVKGYGNIVNDLIQNKGYTHEQAVSAIGEHFAHLSNQLESKKELAAERKAMREEYQEEMREARENKLNSRIDRNLAELGAQCNDMIPGVDGVTALSKFVLDKEFGGPLTDYLFTRDNPNQADMSAEDRKALTEQWFKGFQANRREMALVAEFGKMRWLQQRLPAIIQYAQKVGASKVGNAAETASGGVSEMPDSAGQPQQSALMEWLGADSVN